MTNGSKFLISYRAKNYGIAYLVASVVFLALSLIFNLHNVIQGDIDVAGFLMGLNAIIFISTFAMLLITPVQYFKMANFLGISRKTLFKTDFWTPLLVSLVELILTILISNPDFGSKSWWGVIGISAFLTIGANYFCQMLGNIMALVHGKWKFVVFIAVPVAFITIIIWSLMGLSKILHFENSDKVAKIVINCIRNGWLWLLVLLICVGIATAINWQLIKRFHLMRD